MTTWASSSSEPVPTSSPGRSSGGELPGEMTQVRSRTNLGVVAALMFVNGPADLDAARRVQTGFRGGHTDRSTRVSVRFVTMTVMSELPAGDTHDVIRESGEVVAVVVPIEEYRQLRQAMQEQQVNEEFDAARASYLARREAGAIRYVSHEEAGRRLGMPSR